MPAFRQFIKRRSPALIKDVVKGVRKAFAAPPLEDLILHEYNVVMSSDRRPRVSLVIPDISAGSAFGGVTTSLDFLFALGKRSDADIRIVLDDFTKGIDRSVVDKRALSAGLNPEDIEIRPRNALTPTLEIRKNDIFLSHSWWTTLNINTVRPVQAAAFSCAIRPIIPLIQDYEPQFYIFSATHMMARLAFDMPSPYWAVFNSRELMDYFHAQGHRCDRSFLVEPRLSSAMRPLLNDPHPEKENILLVYGRPSIPRNCFPAVEKGLRRWVERYPEVLNWRVVSAGLPHRPISLGHGASLQSLGKLKIEDYGALLQKTAVGLSLMASPHPSYPPLEMAHFGVATVTNRYANKDLSRAHENIISVADIAPDTIADALALACGRFTADRKGGWSARSHMPAFLGSDDFACIEDLALALEQQVWNEGVA
jgi:hypothetical protein